MKKRLGVILTTVLTLAMTTTALAAGSTTANTTTTTVKAENTEVKVETTGTNVTVASSASSKLSFKDASGNDIANVTVKIAAASEEVKKDAITKAVAAAKDSSAIEESKVLAAIEVSVENFTSGTATIPLTVSGVTKGEAVYAIHVTSSGIEFLDAEATDNGVVTVTTTSFSPIIIMQGTKPEVATTTETKTETTTAPKEGEATSVVLLLAAVSVLGAAACTKKYALSK